MDAFPDLDIYFPPEREDSLIAAMRERAAPPWQWQEHDPFQRPPEDGQYFFHMDGETPCTVCLARKNPGHLYVPTVTPDEHGSVNEQLTDILRDFDRQIVTPAVGSVDGYASIGTDKHTLEDYLSTRSIELLEGFCKGSNVGDLGTHTNDQRRWRAFLLHVFRNERERPSGDQVGALLREKGDWWPESGTRRLAREYDFAMDLLEQAAEPANHD